MTDDTTQDQPKERGVLLPASLVESALAGTADRSMELGKLFAALAKAQGAMDAAAKDKTNPHFRSNYADLASCMDACREPLSVNGLSVVQLTEQAQGAVVVKSVLGHESGQWIASRTVVPVDKPTAHGVGSALTYARRYGLAALVGIVQDDDDGNHASTRAPAKRKTRKAKPSGGTTPRKPPTPERAPGEPDPIMEQIEGLLKTRAKDIAEAVREDLEAGKNPEGVLKGIRTYLSESAEDF